MIKTVQQFAKWQGIILILLAAAVAVRSVRANTNDFLGSTTTSRSRRKRHQQLPYSHTTNLQRMQLVAKNYNDPKSTKDIQDLFASGSTKKVMDPEEFGLKTDILSSSPSSSLSTSRRSRSNDIQDPPDIKRLATGIALIGTTAIGGLMATASTSTTKAAAAVHSDAPFGSRTAKKAKIVRKKSVTPEKKQKKEENVPLKDRSIENKVEQGLQWFSETMKPSLFLFWKQQEPRLHPMMAYNEKMIRTSRNKRDGGGGGGRLRWLLSDEKLPWTLSAMVSLVYLAALTSRFSCDLANANTGIHHTLFCWKPLLKWTEGLSQGFCVWGANPDTGLCPLSNSNSHQFSFYMDMILMAATLGIGHLVRPYASFGLVLGLATMIGLHGLLHFGISNGTECSGQMMHCWMSCPGESSSLLSSLSSSSSTTTTTTTAWQWILYSLYNLGLVAMDFVMANFRLPKSTQSILIVMITSVFIALGVYFGNDWALPAVFVQSLVLVSFTGMFANRQMITPLMGWLFLAATMVGMTEFLACKPFLLQRYGHVWYDIVLHMAMISSLIPRRSSIPQSKGISM